MLRTVKRQLGKVEFVRKVYHKLHESAFPREVWIENTNMCNAKCVMCPRETHDRPLGVMDISLYEKLIREIAEYKHTVKRVHLHNYGEPLLDKRIVERISLAKEYGIPHLYFVTNGSLLTEELSRQLINAGHDEIKVSFYGTDKETYNATMKNLDFDRTIRNLQAFFSIRKEMNAKNPKVVIQYLPQEVNKAQNEKFEELFGSLIDEEIGDSLCVFSLHNWAGGRDYEDIEMRSIKNTCFYPWKTMVILHDGSVVLCCLDYNGKLVVGNAKEQTIKEIWTGERYAEVRRKFISLDYSDYSVCQECDIIR